MFKLDIRFHDTRVNITENILIPSPSLYKIDYFSPCLRRSIKESETTMDHDILIMQDQQAVHKVPLQKI